MFPPSINRHKYLKRIQGQYYGILPKARIAKLTEPAVAKERL
jgi:hypothetical protein